MHEIRYTEICEVVDAETIDSEIGEVTLPWAISFFFFFFLREENTYFSSYAYCFIFKSDLLNPNIVEKKSYFTLFLLKSYFFDEQSKFLDVRFY